MVLVPELSLMQPEAGAAYLQRVFGFALQDGVLQLGSQALIVSQADSPQPHGRIDHIALAVPDIDGALARMIGNGAALDANVTPQGVQSIAEFWDDGIRYVYLSGPEGARIELCQRNTGPVASIGHDHIGIPCRDIDLMEAFLRAQGATPIAEVELVRKGGTIPVRFLAFVGGMVELYCPVEADRPVRGLWSRLHIDGLAAEVAGPDGLILAPLWPKGKLPSGRFGR